MIADDHINVDLVIINPPPPPSLKDVSIIKGPLNKRGFHFLFRGVRFQFLYFLFFPFLL